MNKIKKIDIVISWLNDVFQLRHLKESLETVLFFL